MALTTLAWPITSVMQTLPYMIALFWVLISALYDVSFVLQQSLFLCIYFYLTNMLERLLCYYLNVESAILSTFINASPLAIAFASLLGLSAFSQSSSSVTSFAVLLYSIFLQLLEPVVMFIEMVQIIRFILDFGDRLRSKVFDLKKDDNAALLKGLILSATFLNFGLSLFATIYICRQESYLFAVLSIIVLCTSIILTIVSISYEHIIINPSLIALYTSYLIYLASIESHVFSFEIADTKQAVAAEQNDVLFALLARMELTLDALKKGFLSIALQLSPLFWVAFILRIKCLTSFLEGELCRTVSEESDDDFEQFDDDRNSWTNYGRKLISWFGPFMPNRSALVRIAVVIGFTSIILQRFSTGAQYFLARYQWMVRVVQTFTTAIFYVFAFEAFENSQNDI